ncbi:hypothetical protein BO99DRAFT_414745 [Aspergillus violaceofuscus CBS 115571]|uniref:Uncharacterized protein n=1 Tax=Aspergillus violaceofuscus (strain CBS 115571) TaxID=1450538 RepID=A0A2V5H782_ASPV1|nr:hypothetical protein BO99DRAFT_414745 [Aspergillus violaceofuscus CBS 115571]
MAQLNENDKMELQVALGPLGTGIYYICTKRLRPSAASWHRTGQETAGPALSNWCLAYNQSDDLVWLNTQGYHEGYIVVNSAPGGAHFACAEFAVKARDHEARYMVLERGVIPSMGAQAAACTHADMVELARRWGGYEVTGDEKEYFLRCIRAATQKRDEMAACV